MGHPFSAVRRPIVAVLGQFKGHTKQTWCTSLELNWPFLRRVGADNAIVAIVRTLMTRVDNLSSSGVERTEEEKCVTDAPRGNDYPSGFIRKHTIPRRRREELENERPKTTLTLPYIRGLAEAIRRILDPLGVKVVFRPLRTLRQMLVRPKDPVPVDERKGVVYSIPCVECSSVYIGQTGRCLKQRVKEHRRALKNGDVQASALAEHVLKTGHAVDLSQHTTTRCMLESWYIQHNQAALNREQGTLLDMYTALLD